MKTLLKQLFHRHYFIYTVSLIIIFFFFHDERIVSKSSFILYLTPLKLYTDGDSFFSNYSHTSVNLIYRLEFML